MIIILLEYIIDIMKANILQFDTAIGQIYVNLIKLLIHYEQSKIPINIYSSNSYCSLKLTTI